jgi:hypothetical protein
VTTPLQKHGRRLGRMACTYWKTGSSPCYAVFDNAHSVFLLPKIGSNTDWDAQKLEGEIVKVLNGRHMKPNAEDVSD